MNEKNNLYIIANFGEIFLKGGNIRFFEEKLLSNFLEKVGDLKKKITFEKKSGGAFFMKLDEKISEEEILEIENIVKNTPGFANYYQAFFCKTDLEEIKKTAIFVVENFLKSSDEKIETFGIATDKTDSGVKIKSRDVNVEVGSAV
jgi:thiamine biosynthesis protein ThiI